MKIHSPKGSRKYTEQELLEKFSWAYIESGRVCHGLGRKRPYRIRRGMFRRCNEVSHKSYHRYGGRGIKLERECFWDFWDDMKDGYSDALTLDRIDNNGNYSKENCVRQSHKEQARNRVDNVTYKGKCIIDWSKKLGVKNASLYSRLRRGWSIKDTIEIPVKRYNLVVRKQTNGIA